MKRGCLQSGWRRWPGVVAGALVCVCLNGVAQPMGLGKVSNFSIPEYYGPPNQNQMKSLLSSAEAEPQPGGRYLVRALKAETFRPNGEREVLITAPECVYDLAQRTASSAGSIRMTTGDGRCRVEGEGFLWRRSAGVFIISNRVHTIIHLLPLNTRPRRP